MHTCDTKSVQMLAQRPVAEIEFCTAKMLRPSQWSDIERGHKQAGSGVAVPVQATAETLARMAKTVGVEAQDLEAAGRDDAARERRNLDRNQDLRRRIAAIPGLGAIGKQKLLSANGQELLPLIASGLEAIERSDLNSKAKQELTAMFVDNLVHDAVRRVGELDLMLGIATSATCSS